MLTFVIHYQLFLFVATTAENNKRIAKNTLLLYFRTLCVMAISLYTSRVILDVLGVSDYGIYNVVSGTVAMLAVISGSLSQAISRFITFELGRGDKIRLQKIFANSIVVELGLSIIVVIIGEAVGIWFLYSYMNIPQNRIEAASWVLHCSLFSFIINLISVPYNATIIAHEHMSAFAYISILDAFLKLSIAYLLLLLGFDKLILYAMLMVVVAIIVRTIYGLYCHKHFEETRGKLSFDRVFFKEMSVFAGWKFLSDSSYILSTQGVNMLINVYFGVALNAARGISTQAQSAVMQFVNSFMTSINPQITKYYASGDMDAMYKLVCLGTKYSFYLMLLFAVPFICEADYVLSLWLKIVPPFTTIFLQLSLLGSMMILLGNGLLTAIQATGKIKTYAIWISVVTNLILPFSWIGFACGLSVISTYVIFIIIYFLLNFVRLYIAKALLNFPVIFFVREVLIKFLIVTPVTFILPLCIVKLLEPSFIRMTLTCLISLISTVFIIATVGMKREERKYILSKIKNKLKKT